MTTIIKAAMASPSKETNHEQDVLHLFKAISKGKAHLTRFMLAASGSTLMNCFNEEGRTPLMECCYIREEATRVSMVKTIRDAGADVNQRDEYGRTALIHACQQRCNDVVRILIMHCQIIPDAEDVDGNSALIQSAKNGNDVAVELLVRNFRRLGLQVDHFNKEGQTALHIAAKNGFLQCAKILATKGKATLTIKDKVTNMTPMEMCLAEGYQKSEVDFLKPSVKFYKVAKLTTTMVKYRKKSSLGQESISSVAAKVSPVKTVEKEKEKKQKSKLSLLRKSKTQANDASCSNNSASSSAATKQKSSELSSDNMNSTDKDKAVPFIGSLGRKSGQQHYSNNTDKKSEGMKLFGAGIKHDGNVANKHSPIVKRKTDGMIDLQKTNRPKVLQTSNSTTSPFTEKDFEQAETRGDSDTEDLNTSGMATDTTDLDGDETRLIAFGSHPNEETVNDCTFPSSNFTNKINNSISNNNNKNETNRGLQRQLRHESDNKNDYVDTGEDEGLEQSDYESISDCTLPSMSPITQIDCTDDISSYNDDGNTSSSQHSSDNKHHNTTRKSKKYSTEPRKDSTSPQTEIEYITFDEEKTSKSQNGNVCSKDMTFSGSGNSDISSCSNAVPDEGPSFDQIVTGHVLKLIDDVTTTGDCHGHKMNISSSMTKGPTSVTNPDSYSDVDEENNRKIINAVKLNHSESTYKANLDSSDRSISCSPETIIESLDTINISKDIGDDKKAVNGPGSIQILCFANEFTDPDLNESTS